jgi:5-oxoprolinase (ATP-hydrolysing)
VPVFQRSDLDPGAAFDGPALVFERHTATVVEEGWRAEVDDARALILRARRRARAPLRARMDTAGSQEATAGYGTSRRRPDPIRLELFTNRLASMAREMGEQLRRTALSTNVKERLDFSCALLDARGRLVVSAPHIPVHLGALGVCVRSVREVLELGPGDVAVTNHPGFGGSHLPDVTVITPVYSPAGRLLGYAASRAHHAEIGGTRPGSMPPFANSLAEEGVAIAPMLLVRRGEPRWGAIRRVLEEAPHPSRAVNENLADLRSAVAANHRGAEALRELAATAGEEDVERAMEALQARAARLVSERLGRLPSGRREALERLDDGSPLAVAIEIEGGRATIDFAGSARRHAGNLNATPAVVGSVVMYVLRLLVDRPLPLNDGLLRPVRVEIPPHSILDPGFPDDPRQAPAVAGGNVETSQRLVDALLKALGLAACSQGTMNNVLFGGEGFGYYETVCGGCGAGPGFHGASAVHSHMTNTRITDPEVLERRYPVRLERFAVRRGSGGAGRFKGGDGAVRELTFLVPLSLSVLSQHRVERPYGLEGGAPGLPGRQRVIRASGEVVELGPVDGCEVGPGDKLVLETPGGGGYGCP